MLLTLDDISIKTGMSLRSIFKRSSAMQYYIAETVATGGRPKVYYKPDVLRIFGLAPDPEPRQKIASPRGRHKSAGSPRRPRGFEPAERIAIEAEIVAHTKRLYLAQAIAENVLPCVKDACSVYIAKHGSIEDFTSIDEMAWYYYNDRIMRKDGYNVGVYHRENWRAAWSRIHQIKQTNALMPKNRWEYLSFFSSIGEAGAGFGAGSMWVMDGTQIDTWVRDSKNPNKKYLPYVFTIMDLVTGFPLWIEPIESESIESALRTLSKCIDVYGLPKWGLIVDNGSSFKSKYFQGFIEALYSEEHKDMIRNTSWRKQIFSGQESVCIYPGAMMPTFFGKARLERAFRSINQGFGKLVPKVYQPPRDSMETSYNLGSTPTEKLKAAQAFGETWDRLRYWLYSEFVHEAHNSALGELRKIANLMPTPANAFRYLGGIFDESRTSLIRYEEPEQTRSCVGLINKILPDRSNVPLLVYYGNPSRRHVITSRTYRGAQTIVNGVARNYLCEAINEDMLGRKLCVIPDPLNEAEAFIYLEYDKNWFDELVPEEGSVFYIGKAYDHTVRTVEDLGLVQKRRKLQRGVGKSDTKVEPASKFELPAPVIDEDGDLYIDTTQANMLSNIDTTEPDIDIDDPFSFNY